MGQTFVITHVSPVLGVLRCCADLYGWTIWEADDRITPFTDIGPDGLKRFAPDMRRPDWLTTAILAVGATPGAC